MGAPLRVLIVALVLLSALIMLTSILQSGKVTVIEVREGYTQNLMLSPLTVIAQATSGSQWTLNLSDVSLVQRYVLPTPITNNVTQLFWVLQNGLYAINDAERQEMLVLNNSVTGNKTLEVYYFGSSDTMKVKCKYGYLVFTNGTIFTWVWRQYYNDTDLLFAFSHVGQFVRGILDKGVLTLPTSKLVSDINSVFNKTLGKNYDTDHWSIVFSSDYYIPSRSWAREFTIYYAALANAQYTKVVRVFQVYVDSLDYSEALFLIGSKRYRNSVGNTLGFTLLYINGTLELIHYGGYKASPWAVYSKNLPLDSTIQIRVDYSVSQPLLLLFLFR